MKSYKLLLVPLILLSPLSLSQENIEDNQHAITAGLGVGSNDIKNSGNNEDDWDLDAISQLGYRYQWHKNWALDTRYLKGTSSGFKQIASLTLLDGEIDFDNIIVSGQGRYGFSKYGFIYANLGATFYDWEATGRIDGNSNQILRDESGTGLFAAVGIKGEWHKWEVGFEYQRINMGDLTSSNAMVVFGYKF